MTPERPVAPNPDSVVAAVETLRAELLMVERGLESIDRKAALLPPVLAAVAGFLTTPEGGYTPWQQVLLIAALGTFTTALILAIWILVSGRLNVGPNAQTTAKATHLAPADFNRAVAGSLANAVDELSDWSKWKGRRLYIAMGLAAATILLLAMARVAGGIGA
ncbi:MAG TPA: hypothetical protein VGQ58_07145 [Candidatus Limnocylindrales bacterium]|jgi:hypothetical protein|nr:hypothetical protein [Candidatus Limnocylindrales bacterium]